MAITVEQAREGMRVIVHGRRGTLVPPPHSIDTGQVDVVGIVCKIRASHQAHPYAYVMIDGRNSLICVPYYLGDLDLVGPWLGFDQIAEGF